jgi:hypothetical protein
MDEKILTPILWRGDPILRTVRHGEAYMIRSADFFFEIIQEAGVSMSSRQNCAVSQPVSR